MAKAWDGEGVEEQSKRSEENNKISMHSLRYNRRVCRIVLQLRRIQEGQHLYYYIAFNRRAPSIPP